MSANTYAVSDLFDLMHPHVLSLLKLEECWNDCKDFVLDAICGYVSPEQAVYEIEDLLCQYGYIGD
jgi:hypothetical protein